MPRSAAVLAVFVLAGCARLGAGGATGSGASGDRSAVQPYQLAGLWELASGTGPDGQLSVPPGWKVTLAFEEDRISGQACNLYSGTYRLGAGGAIGFSSMGMTEMACEEPMMSLEAAYHAALSAVDQAAVSGSNLTLSGDDVELIFERRPPVADSQLLGTVWTLETLIQGATASSVSGEPTLILDAGGTLSGSTGCREYSGDYVAVEHRLEVGQLVNTDRACEPGLAAQDELVLHVLSADPTIEIDGSQLTLTAADGVALSYRAAAP
jgi:heat shock protein HslJ